MRQRPGDQQLPTKNEGPYIHDEVCDDLDHYGFPCAAEAKADFQARKALGTERYGTALQAHNGRDALRDLYEELLDATVYCRQALEEETDDSVAAILLSCYQAVLGQSCGVRLLIQRRDES